MKKWIAMLLAVVMCFALAACGGSSSTPESIAPAPESSQPTGEPEAPVQSDAGSSEDTEAPAESETPAQPEPEPEEPGIELSSDLADFTVSIEGVVYQLPCGVDQILNDGWSEGREYTYEVKADGTCKLELWNENNKSISVTVFNPSSKAKLYSDCMILEITPSIWASASEDAVVLIAGGFDLNANLTNEAVIGAFGGEENEHYNNSSSYGLYYEFDIGHYLFTNLGESSAQWAIKIDKSAIRELDQ